MSKIIVNISWDTENNGERPSAESLGLPVKIIVTLGISAGVCQIIVDTMDVDAVIDKLSAQYGYCIEGFTITVEEE